MRIAKDLGNYIKIPADNRDLNYQIYEEKGLNFSMDITEYNSSNTTMLNIDEMINLLKKLTVFRRCLNENCYYWLQWNAGP